MSEQAAAIGFLNVSSACVIIIFATKLGSSQKRRPLYGPCHSVSNSPVSAIDINQWTVAFTKRNSPNQADKDIVSPIGHALILAANNRS